MAVHDEHIEKQPSSELTWKQRLLTLNRRTNQGVPIPVRTLVGTQGSDQAKVFLGVHQTMNLSGDRRRRRRKEEKVKLLERAGTQKGGAKPKYSD